MTEDVLFEAHLALPERRQGKVRDVYQLPAAAPGELPRLLIVATDRISAFDVVMPTPIAGKGRLLTAISVQWFHWLRARGVIADHLEGTDVDALPLSGAERASLRGRIMICRAAAVVPIECVVRGFLAGSGWTEYRQSGGVCGVELPAGLREGDRLPEPIFTPATKASTGHDENINFDQMAAAIGGALAERLRRVSLEIYRAAAAYAAGRGVLLADTKFEFGFALAADGSPSRELLLVDEVLTPDSSRFWPAEEWQPGREQPSFDKQFLREWLLRLVVQGAWNRSPPGPQIPAEIVNATRSRYQEALSRLWDD
jgi:phosphoribosylaminoimidazole-succinocarboxamide synthase